MDKLSYSKVDVIVKAEKPSYFIGSMLRGALGYSLKSVTCINPSFSCEECFASSNCLYFDFYEKKNIYHKYRIDAPLNNNLFEFSFYLYDDAKEKLPYLLSALHKLFTQNGLGRDRVKPKEFFFYIDNKTAYDGKEFKIPKNFINEFKIDRYCSDITVKLSSPLRLKRDNKFLGAKEFELVLLLNSIHQRYLQLTNQDRTKLPFEPSYEITDKNLRWKQLTRYSNRQKTKMSMDGLMGDIVLKNIDKKSYELLKLGEIIGAGKQTVMGLGKIEIKDMYE